MNARQAKRIILWMNGQYLIAADHYGLGDEEMESLSEEDMQRLGSAQLALGEELLRRSGMDRRIAPENIVSAVLGRIENEDENEDGEQS